MESMERKPILLKTEKIKIIESKNAFITVYEEIYDDYKENKIVIDIQPENVQLRQKFKEVERTPKQHRYLLTKIGTLFKTDRIKLYLVISEEPENIFPETSMLLYVWFEFHHPWIKRKFLPYPFIGYEKETDKILIEKETLDGIKYQQDDEFPEIFNIHMACTINNAYGLGFF